MALRMDLLAEDPAVVPAIRYDCPADWGDAPETHRWRATWDRTWDGKVCGIAVKPYPVTRLTEQGAWFDPLAYWHGDWSHSPKECHKWVNNESGQAWVKPTREAAIDSLLYRHKRWSSRILNDVIYFREATLVLAELFPEHSSHVQSVLKNLEFTSRTGVR